MVQLAAMKLFRLTNKANQWTVQESIPTFNKIIC